MITIAISRGRLMEETLNLFREAGFEIPGSFNRNLMYPVPRYSMRLLFTKDFDTSLYVENGIADIGICGKDVLLEMKEVDIYEIENLKFGRCYLVLAGSKNLEDLENISPLKIATKYFNVASEFLKSIQKPFKIIRLNGSVELACVSGLSDLIIDIVNTGQTLKENGLKILKVIHESTARLIANKVRYIQKYEEIEKIRRRLKNAIDKRMSFQIPKYERGKKS